MGAIASGGIEIVNEDLVRRLGLSARDLAEVAARERVELERREHAYRESRPPLHQPITILQAVHFAVQ